MDLDVFESRGDNSTNFSQIIEIIHNIEKGILIISFHLYEKPC